ncbi:MAG: hypothetical protein NC078_04785 [Ruminococcus sp.]|nr:hypothetical protein [Ruminococcus sp.]
MSKIVKSDARIRRENIAKANKSGFIPKKTSLVVYVIVLILAVAARTIQLYTNMNFTTGRYIDPSPMKNYTMMVLIPGFILLAFVLLAGSAKDKVVGSCILINPWRLRYDRLKKKIPGSAGYSALIMAVLVLAQAVMDIGAIVHRNNEIAETMPAKEAKNYSRLTGYTAGMVINHVIMLLVFLTFLSIAINIFKGEGFSPANCATLYIYGVWKTVDIMTTLTENTLAAQSSEIVYEIFSGMTAVVFFMNTARFFNGMEKKYTRFWMCFMGYVSSILAAVSTIPRYIMLLIPTNYDERLDMNIPDVSDIGIVFITITLVAVFWSTYVYRVMPKLNTGNRRWSKAPINNKAYQEMETLDQ